jgi:hypothetical protein
MGNIKFPKKKHLKECRTSLATKKMQIKTTLRFYLTPVRMTIIKNTNKNKYWQGCVVKEPLYTIGGNVH